MIIKVQIPEQQDLDILCRGSDQIIEIKQKIFESRGFAIGFYRLYYNGQELFDVHRIMDYGITDGSTIELTHWNAIEAPPVQSFLTDLISDK
ncbi:unnamed protein product [Chironomus riparius]|uniref:Ubiquitin-like domain-containing protein n=1 Tax=Chironomus riparius TaxID=315576 RepID=A0A9N9RZX6_9DIPT|nr:unnamed protein product [Chironomus riparius]